MLEPKAAPKGPTVNLTVRVPATVIEEMRNASMFNKFSPFPNVSQFAIDAFIRNLELWIGEKLSDEYKAAQMLAQLDLEDKIDNAAAELEGRVITAMLKGQYGRVRKMIVGLPSDRRKIYIKQLQDVGEMMQIVE